MSGTLLGLYRRAVNRLLPAARESESGETYTNRASRDATHCGHVSVRRHGEASLPTNDVDFEACTYSDPAQH